MDDILSKRRGHKVELAGVFYHIGENDMSMPPYRKNAIAWLHSTVEQSRRDLAMPDINWYVSQQPPTDDERVNSIDVTSELERIAAADENLIHIKAYHLPQQKEKLVIDTAGIVRWGELIVASSSGPPRRYFQLTKAGRHHFEQMTQEWESLNSSVHQLVQKGL